MIRALLWAATGVLLGVGLHLLAILAIPEIVSGSAQDRLAAAVTAPGFQLLPGPDVDSAPPSRSGWQWCRPSPASGSAAGSGSQAGAADASTPLDGFAGQIGALAASFLGCDGPGAIRPGADPLLREAACRYDVSRQAMAVSVPLSPAVVSLMVLPDHGPPAFALSRDAKTPLALVLDPATAAPGQPPAHIIPPEATGWIVLRVVGGSPDPLPKILAGARCGPAQGL